MAGVGTQDTPGACAHKTQDTPQCVQPRRAESRNDQNQRRAQRVGTRRDLVFLWERIQPKLARSRRCLVEFDSVGQNPGETHLGQDRVRYPSNSGPIMAIAGKCWAEGSPNLGLKPLSEPPQRMPAKPKAGERPQVWPERQPRTARMWATIGAAGRRGRGEAERHGPEPTGPGRAGPALELKLRIHGTQRRRLLLPTHTDMPTLPS